jgi:hypothetical protein
MSQRLAMVQTVIWWIAVWKTVMAPLCGSILEEIFGLSEQ